VGCRRRPTVVVVDERTMTTMTTMTTVVAV
jgi:hypothetical protein